MPNEPFPRTNNAAGFEGRVEQYFAETQKRLIRNITLLSAALVAGVAVLTWKFAPERATNIAKYLPRAAILNRK